MENKVLNIDFENMNEEQLLEIQERAKEQRQKSLDRRVAELENWRRQATSTINILSNDNKELKEDNNKLNNKIIHLEDITYILRTDKGKKKELTNLIQKQTYKKGTDGKNTLKDKLFHRVITNDCYKHIYNFYQINSYEDIKTENFEESISLINNWFGNPQNVKRVINKKLKEYINDKHLSPHKKNLVDKYLEEINGGNN